MITLKDWQENKEKWLDIDLELMTKDEGWRERLQKDGVRIWQRPFPEDKNDLFRWRLPKVAASQMQKDGSIPIIYLTANADDAHFDRAKATNPYAFIAKPFKKLDLQRALELASFRIQKESIELLANPNILKLDDRIFVRQNDLMCKILIADILYFEADRNYCQVFTREKSYLLINTLKNMEAKLPNDTFQRIHRSYIVNLKQVNEFNHNHITVGNKILPMSKELRPELVARLHTI